MSRRAGWTKAKEALLGTASDAEVARRLGVSTAQVRYRRKALGKAAFADGMVWTPARIALLGTMTDKEVAALLDCSWSVVISKRTKLGIGKFSRRGRPRRAA